ncbi:MAG: hypothetical protein ABSG53_10455 [Thermoguttaceae bacterium]
MVTIIRYGAAVIGLFVVATGIAAEKSTAVVSKNAIDALLTRLDNISHDLNMTTAKKAVVAGDAIEKFNQQYKGKPLTVRLKIQDVVPSAQGHYLTANRPDLDGVQFYTGKFQSNLSNTEVMSVSKDSVLVVTGMVSATNQPQPHIRSEILKPGSSIAFPLHASPPSQICLDNISYQLEVAPKTNSDALSTTALPASGSPLLTPGKTTGGNTLAEKLKNEQLRSVDDVTLFFLKGILQTQHQYGSMNTGATGKSGTGQTSGSNTRPASGFDSGSGSGSAKVKHNRIYTAAELIQKFGSPSTRTSSATSEQWGYKCKDGVVHVHFTQVGVGYARSSSTSKSETLRLEVKSVDSSSSLSGGNSRF